MMMMGLKDIVSSIEHWSKARGVAEPSVEQGWEYLGQMIVNWSNPRYLCQLELLLVEETSEIRAHVAVCDPLCAGNGTGYRFKVFPDVRQSMDELFTTLDMFFPNAKDPLGFCLFIARIIDYDCQKRIVKRARHVEYDLSRSVYREQFNHALMDALKGVGFTQVSFSPQGLLRIDWENPESPLEQKLYAMYVS